MSVIECEAGKIEALEAILDLDIACTLADGFKALADPQRLRIIHLLMTNGETCVCKLIPALGLTQSNISFHLKTLKQAGLIKSRKQGKWIYYTLSRSPLENLYRVILERKSVV